MKRIAIYGAQSIALGTYRAIKTLYTDWNVSCFIVSSLEGNPTELAGIPVMTLSDYSELLSDTEKKEIEILIATPENVMSAIEKSLDDKGFTNYEKVDSVKWAKLQKKYFLINNTIKLLSNYDVGTEPASIKVLMAKFWKDTVISSEYSIPDYCVPIQAGALNTGVRIADIIDSDGDNISKKNGNYSELTALYWMWKNYLGQDDYYGLAHYRRLLMLTDKELLRLKENQIDVILPYPMPYEPNINMHHNRYLSKEEWSATVQAIKELQPEYYECLEDILGQEYMYNYNIVVAKKDVLDAYCSWLFPILFRVEELVDPLGDRTPNRYIGYIGETLETIYFMYNKDRLKIAHTGCRFLT